MIFVDTSALYAVMDGSDAFNARATAAMLELWAGDERLVTSTYVVVESLSLVQRRLGMAAARHLRDAVLGPVIVHPIGLEEHEQAVEAALTANRRGLSVVDASSFALARRLGIRDVFTFDAHFREQGFRVLPEGPLGAHEP